MKNFGTWIGNFQLVTRNVGRLSYFLFEIER